MAMLLTLFMCNLMMKVVSPYKTSVNIYIVLMMEAIGLSETSAIICQTTAQQSALIINF